jgi:hypothetical protein
VTFVPVVFHFDAGQHASTLCLPHSIFFSIHSDFSAFLQCMYLLAVLAAELAGLLALRHIIGGFVRR